MRFVPAVTPWGLEVSSGFGRFRRGRRARQRGPPPRPAFGDQRRARDRVSRSRRAVTAGPAGRKPAIAGPPRACFRFTKCRRACSPSRPRSATPCSPSSWSDKPCRCSQTRAVDFLGIAETQGLLDELEQIAPATVRQVVPKPIAVTLLADVLRRLAEERVNIRDLRAILEALALVGNVERDPLNLAEFVRSQLRRPLTHALTQGGRELSVVLLEPQIEEAIRGAVSRTPAGSFLTLAPAAARDVVSAVRRALPSEPQRRARGRAHAARHSTLRAQALGARSARRARRLLRRAVARNHDPPDRAGNLGRAVAALGALRRGAARPSCAAPRRSARPASWLLFAAADACASS